MHIKTLNPENELFYVNWRHPSEVAGIDADDCIEGAIHYLKMFKSDSPRIAALEALRKEPVATVKEKAKISAKKKQTAQSN